MESSSRNKPIVIGFVGHVDPIFLDDFQQYIRCYPNARIIKIYTSDKKLWIQELKEGDAP